MHRHSMIATFGCTFAMQCVLAPWPFSPELIGVAFVIAFIVTGVAVAAADLRWALARPVVRTTDSEQQHRRGRTAAI